MKSLLHALSITVCTVTAAMTGSAAVGTAQAQSFQPAIVFDMGGKFDKSFNEAAYAGAERFKKETGIEYREFEVTQEAQREQALRTMARRGANVVVGVGFAQASAMEKVSQEFADTKFCIIDSVVERPNVQSITFKEHEGSFLVGMMAALASKTGKVGFVGGMDIPLIRNFATGYQQGVKHANPQAEKLSIGVDSNQNHLHPGSVLTSMIKRVDVAVYNCMKSAKEGSWQAGSRVLGLKEDGVGYSLDDDNKSLVTDDMKRQVEAAKAKIVAGEIQVQPYKQ